jgi:tagatose-6-phosphate ketose/aldose isomerase
MTTSQSTDTTLAFPTHELGERGARWTASEIEQQPALWRAVGDLARARREETDAFLEPLLARKDLRIVLTGAGTSAFAGELLTGVLSRELRRRVEAIATTDLVSNPREYLAEDVPTLLVSFARSGDSPESVAATRLADECLDECYHLVVTCNPQGQLYRDHQDVANSLVLAMPEAANDRGFAMTSSFTCMVLSVLLTLTRPGDGEQLVERLAGAGEEVLATRPETTNALAQRGYERVVYLGSGPLKALARESALKMLELSAGRVATWFDSPLGFRHGPKSVIDPRTLVVVYLSNDPYTRLYDGDIVAELRAAMSPDDVIAVSAGEGADRVPGGAWTVPGVADLDDAAVALPFVLPAQVLALQLSLALGLTPDNPFPGNQVNRVVQGVTIHPMVGER